MRTHGWVGAPPATDDEAVARLLAAGRGFVEEHRRAPRVAEVARELGVSRGTVYRYFSDGEELLLALAAEEAGPFVDDLAKHLAGRTNPSEAVVEAVLFVVDRLPDNAILAMALLAEESSPRAASSITTPEAHAFGRQILEALNVDWPKHGFDTGLLDLLVEQMLRIVQSFVLDPGTPPRHGPALRSYVELWFVPTIEAVAARTSKVSTPTVLEI
jgi:AcrR family transcriptional regulator